MKNNIEELIQKIQEVKASAALEKRIENSIFSLPSYRTGFNYPLIAFRVALASIILFVVAGLGSGVVVAAQGSHPGSLLFPLKKAIVQTQITLTSDADKKAALQKEVEEDRTATPTAKPSVRIKGKEDENEAEKEVEGASIKKETHTIIKREDEENEKQIQLPVRHEDDNRSDSDN